MASISFYDEDDYRGNAYDVTATGEQFEVKEVPAGKSSVASIWVDKGTWLVYTDNNFMGASFLLTPRGYKDPTDIKKEVQALNMADEWKDQVRSLRLVTPGSLMLFDDDFFRGSCSVITASTDSIEDSDCNSLIVESPAGSSPTKHNQVDLVWVLDGSSSITEPNFAKVKQFAANVSGDQDIGPTATRVGMIQFSDFVTEEFTLTAHTDKTSVEAAINSVNYQYGDTLAGKALEYVRTKMAWRQAPAKKVVVVVTDGEFFTDVATPARQLQQGGFIVFAVGVGVRPYDLQQITLDPSRIFPLNNYEELAQKIETLSGCVSRVQEWGIYEAGRFHGKEWKAYPGYYTCAHLKEHLQSVGSAKYLL